MNVPANLKYTKEHEWIRLEGDIAFVGITDYAQSELGEIVFVEVETIGETLSEVDDSENHKITDYFSRWMRNGLLASYDY